MSRNTSKFVVSLSVSSKSTVLGADVDVSSVERPDIEWKPSEKENTFKKGNLTFCPLWLYIDDKSVFSVIYDCYEAERIKSVVFYKTRLM
jgi:hypothetical protein